MAILAQWKWPVWSFLALAVYLPIVVLGVGCDQNNNRRALETASANEHGENSGSVRNKAADNGMLKVWVPAGFVGNDYWVYLDGHIVSAPRQRKTEQISWTMPFGHKPDGPFFLSDSVVSFDNSLRIEGGDFTNSIDSYITRNIDPALGDIKHLFYSVDLPLQPGAYTVEVAYLSWGNDFSSFPFVITHKYPGRVENGGRTSLYVGVPIDWSNSAGRASNTWFCGRMDDGKPDIHLLTKQLKGYLGDPVVQALTGLQVSQPSGPEDSAVLDLPSANGGRREFDVNQIKYIATATLGRYTNGLPSPEAIAECKSKQIYPQFSESYKEYNNLVSDFDNELQHVRELAGNCATKLTSFCGGNL